MSLKGTNNTTSDGARKMSVPERLDKYLEDGTISAESYEELIEKYGAVPNNATKEKRKHVVYLWGYPLKDYLPILFFLSIIAAIGILLSAIEDHNILVVASAIYLLIAFLLYYYSNTTDIHDKGREIANLKQEIRKLESIRKSDKHIIELLEKELEDMRNNSQ